jgi:general secretion pathway protein G
MAKYWHHLTPMVWKRFLVAKLSRTRASGEPFSGSKGFTLLEILVVVAILGLLIGLVAPAALRQLSGAKNSIAKQSIERIGAVLDLYKLDVGTYPSTDQGLAALVQKPGGSDNWNGPYLKGDALPLDPWNRPYAYRSPSERTGHDFDLCSLGASGNAGQGSAICNP